MFVSRELSAWAARTLPQWMLAPLKAIYARYHYALVTRLNRHWLNRLVTEHPATVQSGPFQGMQYGETGLECEMVSKWLGAYEMELHEIVEVLCRGPYTTVINVGCAEGYYTVGLARRLTRASVYAFDLDPKMVTACRRLSACNGVGDRVTVAGDCSPVQLNPLVTGDTLIVSDCEGGELELLDPAQAPALKDADLLVEIHDFINPAISSTLLSRFE